MINDLKELQALFKLCRKQGVTEIDLGAIKIKFGDLPVTRINQEQSDEIPTDELTPEQLMFYSVAAVGDQ